MTFCARFSVLYYIRCHSLSYDLYDYLWMLTITFVGAGTVFMRQNLRRRQILTHEDGPRTERIKIFITVIDP